MKKILAFLLVVCTMLIGMSVAASAAAPVAIAEAPEAFADITVNSGGTAPQITFDPVDISACDYLEFDFFLQDANYFEMAIGQGQFELGSDKEQQDHYELAWMWDELKPCFQTMNAGAWNHVIVPLASGHPQNEPMDMTKLQRIRYYNVLVEEGVDTKIGIKNIKATPDSRTKISFRVDEPSEELYKVRCNTGLNAEKRFADANTEAVYCFPIENADKIEKIEFAMKTGAQLLLQVSNEDGNWVEVFKYVKPEGAEPQTGMNAEYITFDLTDKWVKGDKLYIRVADSYPENGWGGNIYRGVDNTVFITYKSEAPVDPTPVDPTPATFDAVSSVAVAAVAALGIALVASKKRH
ncbi:MAG: hypothetical protein MJ070_07245 [Lachnospiraceae bacterium]|nr:hypothetical protein [Lachnospiraceae bacterium]